MKITWLGHSCFKLESAGYSAVIDPFEPGRVPGYGPCDTSADAVYCSHGHNDHCWEQAVTLINSGCKAFSVESVPSFHDEKFGALRGENTIRVFSDGKTRAVHLGDLGHVLNDAQVAAIGKCDVLLIPVGGFYTIDAETAIHVTAQLSPRILIPMHYRLGALGYDVLGTLDDFLGLCSFAPVVKYDTNCIDISPSTPAQVAVLKYN